MTAGAGGVSGDAAAGSTPGARRGIPGAPGRARLAPPGRAPPPGPEAVGEFVGGGFQDGQDGAQGLGFGEVGAQSCVGGEGAQEAVELAQRQWEEGDGVVDFPVLGEGDDGVALVADPYQVGRVLHGMVSVRPLIRVSSNPCLVRAILLRVGPPERMMGVA